MTIEALPYEAKKELDFILIHGFILNKENKPNEIHRQRLEHGLRLHNERLGKNIIVAGKLDNRDRRLFESTGITLSSIMKEYLIKRGAASERIYEEPSGENTYDCAVNCFKEIILPNSWDLGVIVSNEEHLPRIIWQTKKIVKSLGIRPLLFYSGPSIIYSGAPQEELDRFIKHEVDAIAYSMKRSD